MRKIEGCHGVTNDAPTRPDPTRPFKYLRRSLSFVSLWSKILGKIIIIVALSNAREKTMMMQISNQYQGGKEHDHH